MVVSAQKLKQFFKNGRTIRLIMRVMKNKKKTTESAKELKNCNLSVLFMHAAYHTSVTSKYI